MKKFAMLMAMLLVLFAFGCGEQGDNPEPAGENGEAGETVDGDQGENGGEDAGEEPGDMAIDYVAPQVGQWIAYGVEGEEGEVKFSIVAEEEGYFWYQIEVEGEAVAQILLDPAILGELIDMSGDYMDEFVADPVAYMEEYIPEDGNFMGNQEAIDNMMLFLQAVKKVKINDGTQLMLLDMAGVPELVEQMLAENPDLLDQGMQMDPGQDEELEELMAELEQAEFGVEEVQIDGVDCMQFTATHPEEGTITVAISDELPIIPLMEARVEPLDPEDEGGVVMVVGWGLEGAENLMTGEPDQVIPVAMMLQGMAAQFENAPQGAAPMPQ